MEISQIWYKKSLNSLLPKETLKKNIDARKVNLKLFFKKKQKVPKLGVNIVRMWTQWKMRLLSKIIEIKKE